MDNASGTGGSEDPAPQLAQQQRTDEEVLHQAAPAEGPLRRSPRVAGRKRRNPADSDSAQKPAAGSTAEAETDATAGAAAGNLDGGGITDAPSADREEAAAAAAAAAESSGGPGGSGHGAQQQGERGAAAEACEDGLTPAQRAQVTANRNRALARRAVSDASASGRQPSLTSLLVEPSWRQALCGPLEGPAGQQLEAFVVGEWASGRKAIFPPKEAVFQAFNACPFDQVRVVILGQDPYHGPGQAMGLSFSVPRDVRPLPPSLLNIYKEAAADLGWDDRPQHGDLTSWSVQGVLLLNTCLTVRQGEANSHSKRGWEAVTDAAIRALSQRRSGIVFLLWGNPAQAKAGLVDTRKHHVLKAAHPSPLSASRGFFGCRHFSAANRLLAQQGLPPIEWRPT